MQVVSLLGSKESRSAPRLHSPSTSDPPVCDLIQPFSTVDRLIYANTQALVQTAKSFQFGICHPVKTLASVAQTIGQSVSHPIEVAKTIGTTFEQNQVDGLIQGSGVAIATVGACSIALGIGAYVVAPLTTGKSLALVLLAKNLGQGAGGAGMTVMGLSFAKNQLDAARAETFQELQQESCQLAGDYTGAATVAASYGTIKGGSYLWQKSVLGRRINPSSLERLSRRWGNKLLRDRLALGATTPQPVGILNIQATVAGESGRKVVAVNSFRTPVPDNTVTLYHGTSQPKASLIAQEGFRPSDLGDYGPGVYLTNHPRTAMNYADDAFYVGSARQVSVRLDPAIVVTEVKVGNVLDFNARQEHFLNWARARFNPADLSDDINQVYHNSKTSMSPLMDTTWNRYLPRYMAEFGYDSLKITGQEGSGYDYWLIPDASKIYVTHEVVLNTPPNVVNPVAEMAAAAFRPLPEKTASKTRR